MILGNGITVLLSSIIIYYILKNRNSN